MSKFITRLKKELADKLLSVREHGSEVKTKTRLAICNGCPNYDKEEKRCKVCTCFMEVKAKLEYNRNPFEFRIEKTHCPEGRWGEEDKEIANHYRKIDGKELIE